MLRYSLHERKDDENPVYSQCADIHHVHFVFLPRCPRIADHVNLFDEEEIDELCELLTHGTQALYLQNLQSLSTDNTRDLTIRKLSCSFFPNSLHLYDERT